jgi:hypothetical protein
MTRITSFSQRDRDPEPETALWQRFGFRVTPTRHRALRQTSQAVAGLIRRYERAVVRDFETCLAGFSR